VTEREGHSLEKVREGQYRCSDCQSLFSAAFLLEAPKVPRCYGRMENDEGRAIRHRYEMPPEGWENWRHPSEYTMHAKPLVRHMSYETHRLTYPMDFTTEWERAFAHAWMRQNHPALNHGINNGHGILADLIGFDMEAKPFLSWRPFHPVRWPIRRRETRAAATVVQWLGTNCGRGFLDGVLRSVGHRIVKLPEKALKS